ncbi:hypothetical protein PHLCEN_2v6181 [Hermanssonia centrifuga]|uniref:Uncharacterized protein n=1 Tax=Hermanssonia centrifuga TaxID=98765 RepID=A0A2R6P054_9APHY|nr:hypothetical protein PHLCEN_2v6181 [Hermanssonia centrifuga]
MPMPRTGPIADTLRSPYWSSTAERITRVASLIIEQHADVNLGQFGRTPLSLATEIGNWKLVELLLRHGAHRPPIANLSFATLTDKSLYLALVKKVKPTTPRPPQPCPCWSGQLLSKCHGQNSQPYPADFLCRCGRHKTYRNCCAKRAFKMEEEWDQDNECISTVEVRKLSVPEVPVEFAEDFDAGGQVFREGLAQIQSDPELCREMLEKLAATKAKFFGDALGDEVDPAYAFASNSNDFFPRPWAGQISKQECKIRMDEWNKAVDQYIALGKDKRAKSQIELEAKIEMSGGPLYRCCEASDCPRVEGRDVEKMKCCSACKLLQIFPNRAYEMMDALMQQYPTQIEHQGHPFLPTHLLDSFDSDPPLSSWVSIIHTKSLEKFRFEVIAQRIHCNAGIQTSAVECPPLIASRVPKEITESLYRFRSGDGKTFLHLAATSGDVPLAYEIIRMGADVDFKDKEGVTPLFLASEQFVFLDIAIEFAKGVTPCRPD